MFRISLASPIAGRRRATRWLRALLLFGRLYNQHDMGDSSNKDGGSGRALNAEERSGAIEHDKRGNAVWKWAVDSSRDMLDSTSKLLKKLEVPGLSIDGADPELETLSIDREAGYDPYGTNRSKRAATSTALPEKKPQATTPPAPSKPKTPAPATDAQRPSVLARLLRRP